MRGGDAAEILAHIGEPKAVTYCHIGRKNKNPVRD